MKSLVLEAALAYAKAGIPIFPCAHRGKRPLTEHGFLEASTDEATIRGWFEKWPTANIGMPTGAASGRIVLDIDQKHGGPMALTEWLSAHGLEIPPTPIVKTGGGGQHIYFACPADRPLATLTQGNVLGIKGIEIKAEGGYVILPPSVHESGTVYAWDTSLDGLTTTQLLPVPNWLEAAWDNSTSSNAVPAPLQVPQQVPEGARNETLFRIACKLRRTGLVKAAILGSLRAVNEEQCIPPLPDEELEKIADSADKYEAGTLASKPLPRKDGRPTIRINAEVEAMVSRSIAALMENPRVGLYQRSRILVRITRDLSWRIAGLTEEQSRRFRPRGAPVIGSANIDYLREALDRSAYLEKLDKRDNEWHKCIAPDWLLKGIIARGSWALRHLEGVVEAPTLRHDGSVLGTPGYDELTGLLLEESTTTFAPVASTPSHDDAMLALAQLEQVFADFPFKDPEDGSAAVAAALSVVCRSAIPGPVPLFAVRAPTPGSGKTLLVDAISMLAFGRPAAAHPPSIKPDEERKQMLAIAIGGDPMVLIDNASGAFGSNTMASVLTTGSFSDRVLGVSETATLPMRTVWFVTGNNLHFRGDVGRRVLPIDLDPKCEHPEEDRTDFQHGQDEDYLEWIRTSRPTLLPAALTILRAFILAGRPRPLGLGRLGRFSGWDDLIRGALLWLGAADPEKTRNRIKEWDDTELDTLRGLIEAWVSVIGNRRITLRELLQEATSSASLRDAINAFCPGFRGELPLANALGYALRARKDRMVDGKCLVATKKTMTGVTWMVA